jgi:hypothetical protein
MLRKLGMVGLSVPLIAIVGALIYLFLFGTSEPTFDAATRELARDHTVVRIRDEPPVALVAPDEPPESVILVLVLPDDSRHVWSATQALGLLDDVDSHGLAVIPVNTPLERDQLSELVDLAAEFVTPSRIFVAAFNGAPLAAVCEGGLPEGWSGVAVVEVPGIESLDRCADLPVLRIEDQQDPAPRIVQWMLESQ